MLQIPEWGVVFPLVIALIPIAWIWWGWRRQHGRWWYNAADQAERVAFAQQVKGRIFLCLGIAALVMMGLHYQLGPHLH